MTLTDMRCDRCGCGLSGPAAPESVEPREGVRFSYHPGDPRMRDDSGAVCGRCWAEWTKALGEPRARICARCATPVTRKTSLHLRRADAVGNGWQLCAIHAVDLLNQLRTLVDKLDPATFRFPLDGASDD
jgi:hypothetical protein